MDTNDTVWESYVPKAVDVVTQAPYMVPQRVWLEACRYKACAPLRERADVWFK